MNSFQDRNGGVTTYAFSFPSIAVTDIKVTIDDIEQTYLTHYQVDSYSTTSGGTVNFSVGGASATYKNTSGNTVTGTPTSGTLNVRVYRQTKLINDSSGLPAPEADFTPGSSIRAADLDDNQTQIIYATQEERDQTITGLDIKDGAVTSAKITDDTIVNADVNSAAAVAGTKISPNFGSQAVVTSGTLAAGATTVTGNITVSGTVDGRDVAADGTKLDTIETNAKDDQTAAEIRTLVESASDSNVFTDADHSKLNAIEANATADQTNAEIRTAVEAATDSNVFTDADHSKLNAIEASATADQNAAEIRVLVESASDSNVFTDADHTKLNAIEASADVTDATNVNAAGAVMNSDTTTASMNFVVDEDNFSSNLDTKVPTQQSTKAYIAATSQPLDGDLTTLAGMQSGTASLLAGSTALTADLTELNLLDGKSVVTTVSGSSSDVQLPTAKAVNDQILAVTNALGGFVAIADKDNFPTSNPDPSNNAGTVVSIADAVGISVNSSGVGSLATRAGGSDAVIINGFPSALRGGVGGNANPNVLSAGQGLQVQTTSTAHTYDYHKLVYDEGKAATLQAAVDDFDDRYYGGVSSNPSTKPSGGNRTDGDLYFNTSTNKMKVFNGTHASGTWDDVATPGDFYINTISSYSGTGGNNATFNGTAYRFVLSNPPTSAQQLVVSVNGVIQKPNAGTSQPSEGFAINGSSILFGSPPTTGADYFIITVGSSVNIGTPSDNTVSRVKIQNDAIDGTKIADDAVGAEHIEDLDASLKFADNVSCDFGASSDLIIYHNSTNGAAYIKEANATLRIASDGVALESEDHSEWYLSATKNGAVQLTYDNVKKFETTSAGVEITGDAKYNGATYHMQWDASANSLEFWDNAKLTFGDPGGTADLQIFHDGADSTIDNNTGALYIKSNTSTQLLVNNTENAIIATANGATKLYYDNVEKLTTSGSGFSSTGYANVGDGTWAYITGDTSKSAWGNSQDLQIYHTGNQNFIKSTNGRINLLAAETRMESASGSEVLAKFIENSAVELYHNNYKTFQTTSTGIQVYGPEGTGGDIYLYADDGDDNADRWLISAGTDGTFALRNGASWDYSIKAVGDGAVELYYDNSKKFETTSNGTKVTGRLEVTGGLTDGIGRWDEFENGSTSPSLQVSGTDLNSSCQAWIRATADSGAPKLFIANTRSTSAGGHSAVLNGDELGGIFFAGSDGSEFCNGAAIQAYVHNTPGANDMPGSLYFKTTGDGEASPTVRQKITAYGEVWFNSSSATYGETYKFHNAREDDGMFIYQASTNDYSGIIMRHGRGLSGYSGRMVNFKRNDGTTVGSIDIGASSTAFNTSSDYRLKENQVTITNASTKINQLKPYEFNFKDDPDYKHLGFFAHEVQEVLPQAGIVTGTKDAVEEDGSIKAQSVDYSKLTPILTAALQEALAEIDTLKTKVAALEAG